MFFKAAKNRVLIVEDDASLGRLLKIRLERREKLSVEIASTGEDALEQAQNGDFDLIILDWMLPGVDGIDVLEEFKSGKSTRHIPVLMMTGKNKIAELDEAFNRGAEAYIVKPFELADIGGRVRKLLAA